MTQYPDLFAALAAPFEHDELKIRSQSGRQIQYVTARTVMNRLDSVLGPENWWDEYVPLEHSVVCKLTIRLPDGSTITKSDAGGYAGLADSGDDDKAGFSDAFKRACVKIGVGRYLYRDGVPTFVRERVPSLPAAPAAAPDPEGAARSASRVNGNPPRNGKALFAWTKDQEQRYEVGLLKYLNSWAKIQDFPSRMIDWDAEQVNLAYAEACRKLHAVQSSHQQEYDEVIAN